jgi:hypothetical protein
VTNDELELELDKLRERIETLELDIALMKTIKISEPRYPDNAFWVQPSAPYWHGPPVIC